MITEKITDTQIADLRVSSLPTRPNAPSAFGGRGYSAEEMKAAFDRLPVLIAERLNSLIDDIGAEPSTSISASILTGISEAHTLARLFSDITDGSLATYLKVGDYTLEELLRTLVPSLSKEEEQ